MRPLIDLTNIIIEIKQKISSKNLDFSLAEIEIINLEKELQEEIINLLKSDYEAWKTLSTKTSERLIIQLSNTILDQNYIFNYNKYLIDNGKLNINLNSIYALELKDYLITKLKDPNYTINSSYANKDILKIIVDENRFDLLLKLKYIDGMYEDTSIKLREYYMESQNIIPPVLYNYLEQLNIPFEKLDINALINTLSYLEDNEIVIELIKNKINEKVRITSNNIKILFNKLNDEQKGMVANILLDNNYYSGCIRYLKINSDNLEFYKNKFINAINNSNDLEDDGEFLRFNDNYQMLLNDERVVKSLIANNKLVMASYSSLFKNYVDLVIEIIKNNPDLFKTKDFSIFFGLNLYPDILLELINIGNVSAINVDYCNDNISNYIKDLALKGQINIIPKYLINNDEFINEMIIAGQMDNLLSLDASSKREQKYVYFKESIDYIIERSKVDILFACKFVRTQKNIILNHAELLNFFLKSNAEFIEILLDTINHLPEDVASYTEEMFISVKPYFVNKYNLNEEHLIKLEQLFGPNILRYIANENIINIINLDDLSFNKLVNMFPKLSFTMTDVEKIYDALKQFEFTKTNTNDIEIFARINHLIVDNNIEYIDELNKLYEVIETDNDRFYKKFASIYPGLLENFKNDSKTFLYNIVHYIKSGTIDEKNYYMEILHFITDYYIAYKREKYRDTYKITEELPIPYTLDEKDKLKQFIKNCALKIHKELIVVEMIHRGVEESLANDCIMYYADGKKDFTDKRLLEIKKHIKLMIDIANNIVGVTGMSDFIIDDLDREDKIRRKYFVETNNSNIFTILMELRLDVLKDTLFKEENNDVYKSLLTYIYKYKLHILPDYFKNLLASENIDISLEVSDIASFISYFSQIYETEQKRLESLGKNKDEVNLGIISIMKYAESYSAISSVYSQILGLEDLRLIKSNPKPNAAVRKAQKERLNESVEMILNSFNREEISIPAFNEEITIESTTDQKSLRAVVGNFTHPSTLTLGERTGSCMRIGGVGESLFKFCLEDKNGFHIRFVDPLDGEFISRVSGFRNGNTVFLNELRYSSNPLKYTNEDVVEACKEVAKMLVMKSKDSTCPIDNVVLHNAYATTGLGYKEVLLGIDDNKKGLKSFYSDIKEKGIVIASTGEPFTKVNLDNRNVPIYKPAREIVYKNSDSIKLRTMINRVHTINCALNGLNYEYIEPLNFLNGIVYGIANQDWYIYIDELGNVFEEIINIDNRALDELNEARSQIANYTSSVTETIKRS